MRKHISYGVQGNSCVRPIMLYNIWLKVAGVWHTTNAVIMTIMTSVMLFASLLDHNADASFITTAQATPDTGAEATVAGLDILKQIGLDIGNQCRTPQDTISAANHTSFECVGTVDLHINAADKSTKEAVLICKEQTGLLLAWYVCRDLGIVPNDYPKPIRAITRSSVIKSPGKEAT